MRTTSRHTKIAAALIAVLVLAVSSTAILAYFVYERTIADLANSRFAYIAGELKNKVESGLDLGLPLGELENIRMLLHQHLGNDRALVSICIVSSRGVILFDTEDDRVGKRIAIDWLEPFAKSRTADPVVLDQQQIGLPLLTNYGKVVGGLLLTVSRTYYADKRRRTAQHLTVATLTVLLCASIIGALGVVIVSQPFDRTLSRIEDELRALLHRVSAAGEPSQVDRASGDVVPTFENDLITLASTIEQLAGGAPRGEW